MLVIYELIIRLYGFVLRIAALFHPKAKQWINGRADYFHQLEQQMPKPSNAKRIWMHVASLGEFEQGRPIIEKLKAENPQTQIILTFFSPSGYEIRKNYAHADYITYLPLDTIENAKQFLNIVQPDLVIFVKYDFWMNFLNLCHLRKIPVLLISGLFRKNQFFFKSWAKPFLSILKQFKAIFVQNQSSYDLLADHDFENMILSGDTRIDRVWDIKEDVKSYSLIEEFLEGKKNILICGSTWAPDEEILFTEFQMNASKYENWKIIIAPHDISTNNIQRIQNTCLLPSVKYSELPSNNKSQVLIIDNIGMLSSLYQYGKIAYIGGAFGEGLHNTLEPIAFGLPVVFGVRYKKFEEANYLVKHQGGFSIKSVLELSEVFQRLENHTFYTKASQAALNYIEQNRGASQQVLQYIKEMH